MPKIGEARKTVNNRAHQLSIFFSMIEPVPEDWLKHKAGGTDGPKVSDELLECTDYKVLQNAWRKALKWTPGLDRALSVMLSSITSTMAQGDQLWVKIIGPAASGKSTLCEAVSINHEFVLAKSTIRGFHSGFKSDGAGEEDNSLIAKVVGKTLVTKDGDTLLQSPNLGQILSEARDIYDSTSRSHYRNKMGKDYQGVRMTWILCGTASLAAIDSSELGERFLTCVIMDGIDDELEEEILWRAANKAKVNMSRESGDKNQTQHDAAMSDAMRLTGGYVQHLRKNANELLSAVDVSPEMLKRCTRFGKFIAFMRARPSKLQEEKAEREMASRLTIQITRLSMCLAAVMNKTKVDEEVMTRVRGVVLDTSRGVTLEIAKYLYNSPTGAESHGIGLNISKEFGKVNILLRFLKQIGAIEAKLPESTGKIKHPKARWHLTPTMRNLYRIVMEKEDEDGN